MGQGRVPAANTPRLETERLILRRFTTADVEAFLAIMADEEVNTFLPWLPLRTLDEAAAFLRERYLDSYAKPAGHRYAICLKENNVPAGYIGLDDGDSRDFGYGLARPHWGKGIVTEAGRAVVAQPRQAGVPFITATHDVRNPASGAVMRKIGMTYRYSYEERWQPKDITVTFRLYQLDLDGRSNQTYKGYWERYPAHFVEEGV